MHTVKEVISTFIEIVEQIKEQDLLEWATPDSVVSLTLACLQPSAVAAANTGFSAQRNESFSTSGSKTITGTLEEKTTEVKTSSKGPWKLHAVIIDGQRYSTSKAEAFGGATFRAGDRVTAEVKPAKMDGFWDLVSLKKASPAVSEEEEMEVPF